MNYDLASTWSKLETAIGSEPILRETPEKKPMRPKTGRPRTGSGSLRKNSSLVFSSLTSPKSQFSQTVRVRPLTAQSPRYFKHYAALKIEGFTLNDIRKIYQAKCNDINIPVLVDQEMRFISYCEKNFKNRIIDLRDNGIGPLSAHVLGSVLKRDESYCQLLLGKNVIGDKGAIVLGNSLQKNASIIHIDISSNDINPEGAKSFFDSIANHPTIVSLNMSSSEGLHRNRIGNTGSEPLRNLLKQNKSLAFLNVSRTALGPDGIEFIIEGLQNNESLLSLDISNNMLDAKSIENLCFSLVTSKVIELNLSGNNLGSAGCDHLQTMLCGGLSMACYLQKLDVSYNEINFKGLAKLANGLRNNTILRTLNLEGNPLCGNSSTGVFTLIAGNVAIQNLNLNSCQLGDEGVNKLSEALDSNKVLLKLFLASNDIDDNGGLVIADGLEKNYTLKQLDLSNNRIRRKGGIALANAIKINMTLENLNLKENNIKDDAGQLFSELSRVKQNILKLSLDLNPIGFKYLQDIECNVKKNRTIFKQGVAPKIKEKIKRLALSDAQIDQIKEVIEIKKRERDDINMGLEKQTQRFNRIEQEEKAKIDTLYTELEENRNINVKLSEELENLQFETVNVKRKGDKEIQELNDLLAYVVADMKKLEKQRQSSREDFALRRGQFETMSGQLKETQQVVDIAKKSAQGSYDNMMKKLNAMKEQLRKLKNPNEVIEESKVPKLEEKPASKTPVIANPSKTPSSSKPKKEKPAFKPTSGTKQSPKKIRPKTAK
ncbi:PPP1R37_7 [Blepharisma stoltei]|uniref:Leucine Rich Repeat family protein n=1 Tax=Blepharisma stoltei TaxID=1481888 RepID=A0AAU9J358_9CILI|nr:unnamed protein product [Blepharisma stoltei]